MNSCAENANVKPDELDRSAGGRADAGGGWPVGRSLLLAAAVFSLLSLAAAAASRDFLEADAIVHYLYSRFALAEHHLLVNVWGRPVCTIVYAPGVAVAGLLGAQVTALLLALGTGWITHRIARGQGYRWPALAMIFLLGQPLVFLHSFSVLTELPFAILLAGAFWGYQARTWGTMAVLVGLMPAARPEGLGLIVLAAVALVLHRQWRWLPLLALPLLAWSVAGWSLCDRSQPWYWTILTWVPDHWPYSVKSLYQSGSLWHFVVTLPAVVGPGVFPAILAGVWLSVAEAMKGRMWRGVVGMDHRARCQLLIAMIPVMILAGHSVLFWTGRMASSGELRYMMVVAPMWALLGAKGWEWVFVKCKLSGAVKWAGVAVLMSIVANVVYRVVPLRIGEDTGRALEVARWYESSGVRDRYPKLLVAHPAIYYFTDVSMMDVKRSVEWKPETVMAGPAGTVLVWDPMYGMFNADAGRKVEVKDVLDAGWVLVKVLKEKEAKVKDTAIQRMAEKIHKDRVGRWYIFLSPRDAEGKETQRPSTRRAGE
jgi:hypothetical protein